jgi:putative transposase
MSRTALDGFPLGDIEKDFMLDLIKRYAALYFVEILGFCITQLNSLRENVLHLCPAELIRSSILCWIQQGSQAKI